MIDNGSTDDTPAVLASWCARDARFRTASEPRAGLSRGKNAGARLARSGLVLFTDDDTQIPAQWIASYLAWFSRLGGALAVAGGPIVPVPHDLGSWPGWLDDAALVDAGLLDHRADRTLLPQEYLWGANMAVPRHVFDVVGWWNETAGLQGEARVRGNDSSDFEDTELQDRVRGAGGAVWFCSGAMVHHRVDRRSVTPRRVTGNAFARGRNAVWLAGAPVPAGNMSVLVMRWMLSVLRWGACALLLRLSGRPGIVERTRRAALASGQSLDSLRARGWPRLFRAVASLAFPLRALFLRLTPDRP